MDQTSELLLFILLVKILLDIEGVLEPLFAKWYREYKDANQLRQAESMKQQMAADIEASSDSQVVPGEYVVEAFIVTYSFLSSSLPPFLSCIRLRFIISSFFASP